MKRISYNFRRDFIFAFSSTTFFFTLLIIILDLILRKNNLIEFRFLLMFLIIEILISLAIVTKPIVRLLKVPDTLYIDSNNNLFDSFKKKKIEIYNIKEIIVKEITFYGMNDVPYYEIYFNETPTFLLNKNRKYLIVSEPYNFRNFFSTKLDFFNIMVNLGVDKNKVKWTEPEDYLKYKYGIKVNGNGTD